VIEKKAETKREGTEKMRKSIKILGWVLTSILILFIAGLGLIYLVPGFSFLVVKSGSMSPTFNTGDVIITGPVGHNIQAGTILTYQHGTETITHRVVSNDGTNLVMKGDAVEDADPWPVSVSSARGVYMLKIPFMGYMMMFVRSKLGWFLSIIVPAAAIVGFLVKDILKEAFKDDRQEPVKEKEKEKIKVIASKKEEVKANIKQEVKKSTSATLTKEQIQSNARLRKVLVDALQVQKTGR
jgi:signal peptidase I